MEPRRGFLGAYAATKLSVSDARCVMTVCACVCNVRFVGNSCMYAAMDGWMDGWMDVRVYV